MQPTGLCMGASWEEEETLVWTLGSEYESVCVTCGKELDRLEWTVYQHSFMLLVLSQPWRDAPLHGVSVLSNVAIMSLQMERFPFITKLTKAFCPLHLLSEFLPCELFTSYCLCEHMVYWKYNKKTAFNTVREGLA